uniref:Intraflagellar transport protein 20 n=1 Tax=Polytomella parva TaxID=51329 RepID=A0A7S0VK76_9CHLO|mmetsp:Transcript_7736/g.15137  ORF Transcript_7736/g.15137 Transcript_7736/m.15137 type:complete len:135 (+) Transcript_7736:54-458(+)|eukprot:CAMPEP_0175055104 /NCGR_PEP_ID=MMETSP0052_2-20121109/9885_1 /TAXON_ID=51329 ORGANISM="Polytomella parva, Strain SAG 63-3" /NCGR_SAMPLE_ID=MMETSP0052_2 /ASSEMBLY_ACC=CAM_ASM_000194 /LENGTH=134 /DNA_ID=CAMNT_0016319893 /DNA_START=49 /DNA_END=453 /DNA_ORIENTATION=-
MGDADRGVYFDEEYHIRILDVDKYNASKSLQDNCNIFINNVVQLQSLVEKYVTAIDQQVEKLESEKLIAVGLRNKVAALNEERKRKQKEQERIVSEKQEELERLQAEEQSLIKVVKDQELLLAKLTDSSTGAAF